MGKKGLEGKGKALDSAPSDTSRKRTEKKNIVGKRDQKGDSKKKWRLLTVPSGNSKRNKKSEGPEENRRLKGVCECRRRKGERKKRGGNWGSGGVPG